MRVSVLSNVLCDRCCFPLKLSCNLPLIDLLGYVRPLTVVLSAANLAQGSAWSPKLQFFLASGTVPEKEPTSFGDGQRVPKVHSPRAFSEDDAARANQITSQFPTVLTEELPTTLWITWHPTREKEQFLQDLWSCLKDSSW